MIISLEEVLRATGGKLLQGEANVLFQGVSTDSRNVTEGELFIALKGSRFDGHHYALEALDKKAGGVVIEEDKARDIRWNGYRPRVVVGVRDTLRALGDLARERRRKYQTPVVALTGSNGKTTTKEMISVCLETTFPILKTKGNLNNLIGLPLTLLNLTEKEKIVILEMGMNVPGEIRRLTEIAEPDVGLITNIQEVHLQGMGSLERIKEEKGELFRKMKKDGTILVNQDDSRVIGLASEFAGKRITYGVAHPADAMAKGVQLRGAEGTRFTLLFQGEEMEIALPLLGRHFVPNALSAIVVARAFGIKMKNVREALEHFKPIPMRMEVIHLGGGKTLINDTYNANPKSMEMALETLTEVKGKRRAIAVLGDMLELGDFASEAHRRLGQKVRECSIDFLIVLGEKGPLVAESAMRDGFEPGKIRVAEDHAEGVSMLKQMMQNEDWILVKGSRGMAMEKIVEGITEGRT